MASEVLSELLFPSDIKCIACLAELDCDKEFCICDKCALSFIDKPCLTCGRQVDNMASYCERCLNYKPFFDKARSAFRYEKEIKSLIQRYKYGNEKYLAKYFSSMLYKLFRSNEFKADIITFVPLHPKRQKTRGFNQSELIADGLSALTGLPLEMLLSKNKHTKNMAKLDAQGRRELIKGTFSIYAEEESIKKKKVLLIDDVMTTGSTVNECAFVLKKNGAAEVNVLTVASLNITPNLKKRNKLKDIPKLIDKI